MNTTRTLGRLGLIFLSMLFALYVEAAFAQGGSPTATPTPQPAPADENFDRRLYQWTPIAGRFDLPVGITHAGDGSGRLFVLEQAGFIWIIQDEQQLETPFLDIREMVPDDTFRGGYTERGLLGMAFHPEFKDNGVFFVNYIDNANRSVIDRYRVMADDPNRADPASRTELLAIPKEFHDHNGGQLAFGPDGYLYFTIGDGGGQQGDLENDAQNMGVLLGKILRLDVNDVEAESYAIPPDNPHVGEEGVRPEIWAHGLRNPWRLTFDRLTGDMYIADVGWGNWEEISFWPGSEPGGVDFGWNYLEGTHPTPTGGVGEIPDGLVPPIHEYDHNDGCSITGGYVYRGEALPELQGYYVFGDYCNGRMWVLRRNEAGAWVRSDMAETGRTITSYGEDEAGELYMTDYKGFVLRLERAAP
ncbi:MAG: PQQ-dependent sugar dehydrogenase [Anaerolineae bacterium]|nr:PQQ-dependent sugar dehydrogenase [Anaerolineae bacterium]